MNEVHSSVIHVVTATVYAIAYEATVVSAATAIGQ